MGQIGFVGLGNMGGAIATRLMQSGHELIAYDLDARRVAEFRAAGAQIATSSRHVGDTASVVFVCLPSCEASLSVANEVMQGSAVRIYVEMSTIGSPTMADILAAAPPAVSIVDAPVSGGPAGAKAGTLAIMVAGNPDTIGQIDPLLKAIAGKVFRLGEKPGLAQVCKLVNNAIAFSAMIASFEAIVLGVKAGLNAATLVDVINVSSGRNVTTLEKIPSAILPRTFDAGGALGGAAKDLELYLELAEQFNVLTPCVQNTLETWRAAMTTIDPEQDHTNLIRYFEQAANVKVSSH